MKVKKDQANKCSIIDNRKTSLIGLNIKPQTGILGVIGTDSYRFYDQGGAIK